MSDDARKTQEAAEPPEEDAEQEWDVEMTVQGTLFITVTAKDEDEAHDAAMNEWRYEVNHGEIDYFHAAVDNVSEAQA